jgi:hypothetical protein
MPTKSRSIWSCLWNRRSVVRAHPILPPQEILPHLQHVTDRPDVFARPKIQKALRMALRMVALSRAADGRWFARKGIPKDVREDYARLYSVSHEALREDLASSRWTSNPSSGRCQDYHLGRGRGLRQGSGCTHRGVLCPCRTKALRQH